MAKAKDCEQCGKRFLAESNEPQLCIMCRADFDFEQERKKLSYIEAKKLGDKRFAEFMEGDDDGDSRKIPRGNDVG